ncbi:MAG: hypothetical protein IPO58_25795 [Betaproteobacteria bacterium]|nr:hypothetical protein [Betaproteobacteria bacterium]
MTSAARRPATRPLLVAAEPFRLVNRHAVVGGDAIDRAQRQMLAAFPRPESGWVSTSGTA